MKKVGKYIIYGLVIIVLALVVNTRYQEIKKANKVAEEKLVNDYVTCLYDNFTQRDYCARQVGSEYHYMDLLIEKYGYTYEQVGYDLYLVKSESVNK